MNKELFEYLKEEQKSLENNLATMSKQMDILDQAMMENRDRQVEVGRRLMEELGKGVK